jgi:hypothetical protein
MARDQTQPAKTFNKVDPVWARIRQEAEMACREPELSTFFYEKVLLHATLEAVVIHRVSERLGNADVSADLICQAYGEALQDQPTIGEAFRADIVATVDRDPASGRLIEPVIYYKGFHAIQTHRLAHWLLDKGRKEGAFRGARLGLGELLCLHVGAPPRQPCCDPSMCSGTLIRTAHIGGNELGIESSAVRTSWMRNDALNDLLHSANGYWNTTSRASPLTRSSATNLARLSSMALCASNIYART